MRSFPLLSAVLRDRRGVTRVEYGIIASAVAITCVTSIPPITRALTLTFATVDAVLKGTAT